MTGLCKSLKAGRDNDKTLLLKGVTHRCLAEADHTIYKRGTLVMLPTLKTQSLAHAVYQAVP